MFALAEKQYQNRRGVVGLPDEMDENKIRYMRKTYESPLVIEVKVEAEQMLAASFQITDEKVDTSEGGQLTSGHRGEWGNLWGK